MRTGNPKSEIRNPKQARMSQTRISKRSIGWATAFRSFGFDSCGLVSNFVLRISILVAILASVAQADSPDANDPSQRICEQTASSFVMVSYHLKKSERPYLNGGDSEYGQQSILQGILNKNSLDAVGVIVGDKGEVFTYEREPAHWEVIDHITIKGVDGTVVPAKADRLLVKAPGRIVRIEGALPAGWKPLTFADCGPVTPTTNGTSAGGRPWSRTFSPTAPRARFAAARSG